MVKFQRPNFITWLELSAFGFTASGAARLTGLSTCSVNDVYLRLRHRFLEWNPVPAELAGAVELDESYFGPRCVRGKRSWGVGENPIVFGLLKRGGQRYTNSKYL